MSKLFRADVNRKTIPFYLYANGEYFYWSNLLGEWLPSQKIVITGIRSTLS